MAGQTDYLLCGNLAANAATNTQTSAGWLGYITAQNSLNPTIAVPNLASVWLGLFTVAPTSDSAVTGATEPSTNGYARVQVAGSVTTTSLTSGASGTINVTALPAWVQPGMYARDTFSAHTGTGYVVANSTITSVAASSFVISPVTGASGVASGDTIALTSYIPPVVSAGTEPAVTPAYTQNNSIISFPQATSTGWGSIVAWGLFDAASSGNCLFWDWLGNNKWVAAEVSAANPGVFTVAAAADAPANGTTIVVSNKMIPGGVACVWTTPANLQVPVTTAGLAGSTFNVSQQAATAGSTLFRQVTVQPIAGNVTPSFAAGTFVITGA